LFCTLFSIVHNVCFNIFHKIFAHLHYVGLAAINTEKKRIGLVKNRLGKGKEIVMSTPSMMLRAIDIFK